VKEKRKQTIFEREELSEYRHFESKGKE